MYDKNSDEINAPEELVRAEESHQVRGERGALSDQKRRSNWQPGAKTFMVLAGCIAIAISVLAVQKAQRVKQAAKEEAAKPEALVKNTLPPLQTAALGAGNSEQIVPPILPNGITDPGMKAAQAPAPVPALASPPPVALTPAAIPPAPAPQASEAKALSPEEELKQRRLSSPLNENGANRRSSVAGGEPPGITPGFGGQDSEYQNKLKPLRLSPSKAGLLSDRNYLLTQGEMIDCALDTKIVTAQPGMTKCYTTRDIYSANGRVVLIERGSKIVGNYQAGIQQGQSRVFVLWTRIETPQGVIVNLDSPGVGALGEAGLGGNIDRHFWERFGGAILISLIGDVGTWVAQPNQGTGSNSIQFTGTAQGAQQAATEALRNSINIPPTLTKNQGDRVAIYVARDLDFSGVYDLALVK